MTKTLRGFAFQSDSDVPGKLDQGVRSKWDPTDSSASGRTDDVSSGYSVDDFSRARNYVSAGSGYDDEEEKDRSPYYHPAIPGSVDDDEEETDRGPYFHPAMPTPAENPAPPPPPMKPEDPTPLQSFFASPIDFIFGGNDDDDDDVSTLDGGSLHDAVRWGDDATIITADPISKPKFNLTQQVIYEDDEAEDGGLGTASKETRFNNEGSAQERTDQYYNQEDRYYDQDDQYYDQEDQYYDQDDQYYDQEDQYHDQKILHENEDDYVDAEKDMYTTSEYLQAHFSESEQAEENSLYPKDSYSGSYQDIERSNYSASGLARFSVSDEDAARSRAMDDDASLSLSLALGDKQSQTNYTLPTQEFESWRSTDSASIQASQSPALHKGLSKAASAESMASDALRRAIILNKSWRSVRSDRSGFGDRSSRSMGSAAISVRHVRNAMPETPEILPRLNPNAPVMTRGMSGRPVVHVSMDCSRDGSIMRLDYTMPVVDVPVETDAEYFDDEDTVVAANKSLLPWYDYYFSRSKIIQTCHSRKCYRINAVLLLAVCFILAVAISTTTVISSERRASSSSVARRPSSQEVPPPRQFTNVKLPSHIDTHLKDWFNAVGTMAAGKDDVPFYFHIPLSGALIASECWTRCLGFVVASDGGKAEVGNTSLNAVQVGGSSFVNVDLSNLQGIEHAAKMNLVPSSLPDVAISPLFNDAIEKLFSKSYPSTLIITLRHPISRAVAMFDYTKKVKSDPELAQMTLDQFALSGHIENNYVVRLLTGKSAGSLSVDDVTFCKELLRRKAIIGLYEDMERSMSHFQRYFGWTPVAEGAMDCEKKLIQEGLDRESAMTLDPGSSAYSLIRNQNLHDIALYDYVRNFLVPYQMEVMSRQSQGSGTTGR